MKILIIGAVLTGIALIMIIVGVVALSAGTDYTNPEDEKVGEGTGTFSVSLKSGKTYQIWTKSGEFVTATATVNENLFIVAIDRDGWSLESEFTATTAGSYTINITDDIGGGGSTSKSLVTNQIDTDEELEDIGGGIVAYIFGWCGGLALGIPGVILLVIGLILTLTQKKKETPAGANVNINMQQQQAPGQPQQPAPGSYEAMYGSPPPQQPPQTPPPY